MCVLADSHAKSAVCMREVALVLGRYSYDRTIRPKLGATAAGDAQKISVVCAEQSATEECFSLPSMFFCCFGTIAILCKNKGELLCPVNIPC